MLVFAKNLAVPLLFLAAGIVFLLSLSGRVRYGLLFLVPLFPLVNVMVRLQQYPLGKDINDIIIIGMLIGWILSRGTTKEPLFIKSPFNKLLIIFGIYTLIGLWRGSAYLGWPAPLSPADPRLQMWKNYMLLPLMFFITANNIKDTKEMQRLFIAMCLSMFVMNYYMVKQISWATAWVSRDKFVGTFVFLGPNEVAAFYAAYTFILMGIFMSIKEKRLRLMLLVLIWVNFYCILFLMSRGAYVAVLLGLLLFSAVRMKILIVPILCVLFFWQTLLPEKVVQRIEYTRQQENELQEVQLDHSAQQRLELWEAYLTIYKQNPVFGVGYNASSHLLAGKDTHNMYIRTLADEGVVGLALLLTIMLVAFRRGWILFRKAKDLFLKGLGLGFCACVVAVLTGNFFGDRWTYLQLATYFWVFLGMVERGNVLTMASSMQSKNSKQSTKRNVT